MPLYITVSEGPTAGLSEPIVATSDEEVVRVVGQVLARRLGVRLPGTLRRVPLPEPGADDPPTETE